MTKTALVLKHLKNVGHISIRDGMDDYSLSGGSLTKHISLLRAQGHNIEKVFRKHPITGTRYARYFYHGFGTQAAAQ
jgi:Helix-turn-helix domain